MVVFGGIIFYLTATRLFSMCTINIHEVTQYESSNPLLNLVVIVCFVAILYGIKVFLSKRKKAVQHLRVIKLVTVLVAVFGTWLVISTQLWPHSDQMSVFAVASELRSHIYTAWQKGGYMFMYPNQNGDVFFIWLTTKIIGDYNNVGLQFINVVSLVGTYLCAYGIYRQQRNGETYSTGIFIGMCAFLPLAMYVTFVYGTLVGLFLSMAALLFADRFYRSRKVWNLLLAGVLMILAVLIKSNYLIFMIGMLVILVLDAIGRRNRGQLLRGLAGAAAMIVVYVGVSQGFQMAVTKLTGEKTNRGMPVAAWISMGMNESERASGWFDPALTEGVFSGNQYDIEAADRQAHANLQTRLQEFQENPAQMCAFYSRKIASQWNNPEFQGFWIQQNRESKVYMSGLSKTVISGENKVLNLYVEYYHLLVLFGVAVFIIFGFNKIKARDLTFAVIFVGGFLFHILWEAKCQYTVVYFVLLVPYAVRGYQQLVSCLEVRFHK